MPPTAVIAEEKTPNQTLAFLPSECFTPMTTMDITTTAAKGRNAASPAEAGSSGRSGPRTAHTDASASNASLSPELSHRTQQNSTAKERNHANGSRRIPFNTRRLAIETVSPEKTDGSMTIQSAAYKDSQSDMHPSKCAETNCDIATGKPAAIAKWVANPYFDTL